MFSGGNGHAPVYSCDKFRDHPKQDFKKNKRDMARFGLLGTPRFMDSGGTSPKTCGAVRISGSFGSQRK